MKAQPDCTCECLCGLPPDLPNEEWRWVIGQEGRYQVSNLGRARSYVRKGPIRPPYTRRYRMLTPSLDSDGYRILTMGGKGYKLHRAILEAFVGPSQLVTRHLNNNPADNRLENLAWGTQAENMADRKRYGHFPTRPKAVIA